MARRRKYGNAKVEYEGMTFDSRREFRRFLYLTDLQKNGEISGLELQKPYLLIPAQYVESGEIYKRGKNKGKPKMILAEKECVYKADFVYTNADGTLVVEDAKGVRTKEYVIKRKLMLQVHGIKILEV